MKKSILPLLALSALATLAPLADAQPSRRPATAHAATPDASHARDASADALVPAQRPTPAQTPPAPAPQPPGQPPAPGICCCRVWSHGWQYSWRPGTECTAQNGSCVTPDHC